MRAVIVAALVDRDLFPIFPAKEGAVAIGAEVFGLIVFAESLLHLKKVSADFAFNL